MLTDLAAQLWPALPLFFLAGCCFVLGGFIWLVAIRRTDVALGPLPAKLADPPARIDADTAVIPRIPGVAESALARRIPPYLAQGWQHETVTALRTVTGPTAEETERLAARLCAPLDIGPVCPTCGGPWGNCTCATTTAQAECPLTTDEIPDVTIAIPNPHYGEAYTALYAQPATQDLTEKLKKVTA